MKRALLSALIVTGVLAAPLAAQIKQREITDEDVDRAIAEAKRALYAAQQEDGHWYDWNREVPTGQGHTAIALFALLEALQTNESLTPQMIKGFDWLDKQDARNTYVVATRLMAFSELWARQSAAGNKSFPYTKTLNNDIKYLVEGPSKDPAKNAAKVGAWGYSGVDKDGDNSCSQFALLALYEAQMAGLEVPSEVFKKAESVWITRQQPDGGWRYAGKNDPTTLSMTLAALASLYQCQDAQAKDVSAYAYNANLDRGWKFLSANMKDENFFLDKDKNANGYLLFCLQRVANASGVKFINNMDWFAAAANKLCEPNPRGRPYNGQYGSIVQASLELIFLSRSRLPMTFNKLEYGQQPQWNAYPRDVPRFTQYMRRTFDELKMRWQVVKLTDDVRMLLDAPILLIEGSAALTFSEQDWARLREYTLRGGTILMIPNNNNRQFIDSAEKALAGLYKAEQADAPAYFKLEKLPDDHPLYGEGTDMYKVAGAATFAPIEALSDGTRMLVILCHRDIPRAWQARSFANDKNDFELSKNIYFYATGHNSFARRLRPVFVAPKGEVKQTARIAWLRHEGNCYTSPYALKYLSEKLTGENRVALDVQQVNIAALAGGKYNLAWMTGADAFTLKDEDIDRLKAWLNAGGTLFVNAVNGSRTFRDSAEAMLEKLFGNDPTITAGTASSDSSFITGVCGDYRGPAIKTNEAGEPELARTVAWRTAQPKTGGLAFQLYTKNQRPLVIFCKYGLHDTLDGHTAYKAFSYMPSTARDLAANIVLTALMSKPGQVPAPGPAASGPAASGPAAFGPATGAATTKP
ncbi:MAG: DUF4159 domain-containing protein [Phycisphaerae bacterium]